MLPLFVGVDVDVVVIVDVDVAAAAAAAGVRYGVGLRRRYTMPFLFVRCVSLSRFWILHSSHYLLRRVLFSSSSSSSWFRQSDASLDGTRAPTMLTPRI